LSHEKLDDRKDSCDGSVDKTGVTMLQPDHKLRGSLGI